MLRRKKGKSYPLLMKRTSSLMFVFLVLFWPACNKGQKSKSNASVEFIDGVECIHNTGTPLHPDKTVTFVEDLSISGEDKDGNIILYEPRLSFVDDNENIYIIERKDQVIKVFRSDGKHIKTIGAKGSGPGEFQTMTYLAVTKDGKLIAMDETSRRTSLFDSSGRFLKSSHWQTYYGNFIMIKSSSYITSELIYSGDRQFRQSFVKEVDFNGKEIRSYGEFSTERLNIIRQGKYTNYFSPPVSTSSIFAGDQDRGLFYHCVNNKYIIEVYDTSGKLFRKIDRPYEPVPFTDKDAKEYRARFGDLTNDFFRKAIEEMEMPKVKSIVERMCVDDEGNLWIRTNEIKEEEDKIRTAFDIFDSDGYYFAKVWTAVIPSIFKKGKMYRMDTDQDTGYQSLKRYKVIWE
jgi:hypothetical protein